MSYGSKNRVRIQGEFDDKISSPLAKARDEFDRLGKSKGAKAVLQGIGMGAGISAWGLLTDAIGTTVDFIGGSIEKASDLNETVNKSNEVFGASARKIEDWGSTAATSIGQSKQQAIEAAATFGNLFESMGIGQKESADLSVNLVNLASDLASFNNIDPTEVLQKLQSGIVGETKAVRDLGVDISETTVQQELLREGAQRVNGEFTQAQKIQARYALILQQTGNAQGDFARTSGGLANTQRTLQAQMDDLQAEIGQQLLPIMVDLAHFARDDLVPALRSVVDASKGLGDIADTVTLGKFQSLEDHVRSLSTYAEDIQGKPIKFNIETHEVSSEAAMVAGSLDKVGDSASTAKRKVVTAFKGMVDQARTARQELSQLGSDTADALFDPIILQGELAADKAERQQQRRVMSSKKSSAQEVADAKQRLAELNKDVFEKELALLGYGKLNSSEQARFLDDLKKKWGSASGEAKADIADLIYYIEHKLPTQANVVVTVKGTGGGAGRKFLAAGGPVFPGETAIVGEQGPETLVMGRSGGYVIPHADMVGAGGYGSPVVIQLTLDGRKVAEVTDRNLYYRAARAPQSRYAG